jgi:hypothetical protein
MSNAAHSNWSAIESFEVEVHHEQHGTQMNRLSGNFAPSVLARVWNVIRECDQYGRTYHVYAINTRGARSELSYAQLCRIGR